MPHRTAADWIELLELQPLPDGGYFRETYRAQQQVITFNDGVPDTYMRPAGTAIYYLLTPQAWQAFHRLDFDVIWHYYAGAPCQLHFLHSATGRYESVLLGPEPESYQRFNTLIPRGTWYAAEVSEPGDFSLVGCTMMPGFMWGEYQVAAAVDLVSLFPNYRHLIERLVGKSKSNTTEEAE